MANHASAKKAARQAQKRNLINTARRSRIKTYVKKVILAISNGDEQSARNALIVAQSEVMRGVTKGVLKLNTASRIVSRLAKKVKTKFYILDQAA